MAHGTVGTGTVEFLDRQTFNSSGTWTKPALATNVHVWVLSGGGGGEGGHQNSSGYNSQGGGGGGVIEVTIPADELGATESVTVGAGGAGGVGTSNTYTAGSDGGTSSVGNVVSVLGGRGGDLLQYAPNSADGYAGSGGGSQWTAMNQTANSTQLSAGSGLAGGRTGTPQDDPANVGNGRFDHTADWGGGGGHKINPVNNWTNNTNPWTNGAPGSGHSTFGAGGGGCSGAVLNSNAVYINGSTGGDGAVARGGGAGGAGAVTNNDAGADGVDATGVFGAGGGGGGGGSTNGNTGDRTGGDGGVPGGGGGGTSKYSNANASSNSVVGGAGAAGRVIITSYR